MPTTDSQRTYTIGQASAECDVPAHVLRYWETEFDALEPAKNQQGHRAYVEADLHLIRQIKRLLRVEKYTLEGARQRLGGDRGIAQQTERLRELRAFLVEVRDRIV